MRIPLRRDFLLSECKLLATIAEVLHPIPFRTRQLSPPAPMVLLVRTCGRVGRCQSYRDPVPRTSGRDFFYPPNVCLHRVLLSSTCCILRPPFPGDPSVMRKIVLKIKSWFARNLNPRPLPARYPDLHRKPGAGRARRETDPVLNASNGMPHRAANPGLNASNGIPHQAANPGLNASNGIHATP